MTRHPIAQIVGAIAALAIAASCATTPKAAKAPSPAAPPPAAAAEPASAEPAAVPAPDAQRAKAAALRKRAFDLGLKELLPADYAAADAAFAEGIGGYGKDNAASTASFADSSVRFGSLISESLPMLAAKERGRAEALRDTALGKRADGLFPELFSFAEAEFAVPTAAEASGDYEAAAAGYRASSKAFEVLYKLCDAESARKAIVARDFEKWDPSNWTLAETKFAASRDLLPRDAPAAGASVDEAILRYGLASRTALEYYASDRKLSSEAEKDRASGIKAEVAVKDEFASALAIHSRAEAAYSSRDFEGSSSLYDRAAAAFAAAYGHAKTKMDATKAELDSLDAALSERGID